MAISISGSGELSSTSQLTINSPDRLLVTNGLSAYASASDGYDIRHAMGGGHPQLQTPSGSQITPFEGWTKPYGTYTEEFRINSGVSYETRSAQEQELLTAMGRQVTHLVPSPIIVYRWSAPAGRDAGNYFGAYYNLKFRTNGVTTCAAFTKLLSGETSTRHWLGSGATSEWKLTGSHYMSAGGGYVNSHPHAPMSGNTQAEYLIAMPAHVDGYVDLENPQNWWFFPNRDGGWG